MTLIDTIEDQMSHALARTVGGPVSVVFRCDDRWTIYGKPEHVAAAVAYVTKHGIMALQDQAHDDELGETFAYLTSGS